MPKDDIKPVTTNRKAYHDFFIEETLEAGISLAGTEVKSLREGRAQLKDSYVQVKGGEAWLIGCHISPYSHGNIWNLDPERTRKLLLHKREIKSLLGSLTQKGYTLIPLKLYFKGDKAKLEIGLAKGKKLHDVRDSLKEKEARREVERAVRERQKES